MKLLYQNDPGGRMGWSRHGELLLHVVDEILVDGYLSTLTVDDSDSFLRRCLECLRPGGKITVITKDLRSSAMLLLRGQIEPHQYWSEIALGFNSYRDAQERLTRGEPAPYKSCYDADMLFAALIKAGFIGVCPIDIMTHPYLISRVPTQIGMEAVRPL